MFDNIKFQRDFNMEIESTSGETITIKSPLTIDFNIVRNVFSTANSADIKIFNLSERIRNLIYKDRYATVESRLITLKAGYGDDAPIIFKGELRSAESYRVGTEFITAISALDGGLDQYKAFSSNTAAKGSAKIDAINNQLNNFENVKGLTIGEFGGTYKRGRVFMGNTMELLDLETKSKAFIDNQELNILNDDEVKIGAIQVINSDVGLLNSPRRSNTQVVFKLLFEPRLIVGQKLVLESVTNTIFNGAYRVSGIQHSGVISAAVSGRCETEVNLNLGIKILKVA